MVKFWSQIYGQWKLTNKIMFWIGVIGIFSGLFFGGREYILNLNNNSININSPQLTNIYNQCDPYEILSAYDEQKHQNKSFDVCVNNLTKYYYDKCGIKISAYLFDSCDVLDFSANISSTINSARFFLVYPFWNKTESDYYFLDEILIDNGKEGRISIFVTQDKILKARFVENNGVETTLSADVKNWNEKEWAAIMVSLAQNNSAAENKELFLSFKDLHNETNHALATREVVNFRLAGDFVHQFWGSDINGKNQANAVIANADISYFLPSDPNYNPAYIDLFR